MGWFETLVTVVMGGFGLGGILAGLLQRRKTASVELKDAMISDLTAYNKQLEGDKSRLQAQVEAQAKQIAQLESEKRLPLERLTKLMVKQHNQQTNSTKSLAESVTAMVDKLGVVIDRLSPSEKSS